MQTRQTFFPITVALTTMALGFAAGVYSAPVLHKTGHHYLVAASSGPVPAPDEPYDYFPSHYVNQATQAEELPAQF